MLRGPGATVQRNPTARAARIRLSGAKRSFKSADRE
ncbi:hypothetical protein ABIC90_001508 [Variovorax boronicumulans]